jgi:leader peptidase (prepilin peptidase)/N-methyltransferase
MCPHCKSPIKFYDNIPILSYLLLFGRCRYCKAGIAIRYPLVELLTGLMALAALYKYGITADTLILFIFISSLIVITFIDIDHKIIPDVISITGIPVGFLSSFILTSIHYKDSLIGIFVGGGSLFIVAWSYHFFTGKEGMGGGDIKLLAMIGAFIGWQGVFFTIFIASATGSLIGVIVMLFANKNMKFAVPFGPFLAIGAVSYLFFGPELISWYYQITF